MTATNSCVLILYTFLYGFIVLGCFCGLFRVFGVYQLQIGISWHLLFEFESLWFSSLAWMLLLGLLLWWSGHSDYPCLVSDLSGNAFSLSALRKILTVDFCCCCCYLEQSSFHPYYSEGFYHEWVFDIKSFLCIICSTDTIFLSFYWSAVYCLAYIKWSLHP